MDAKLLFVVTICMVNVIYANWISPTSPLLLRADSSMAICYYNNSIYLIGGYENRRQLVEYNILNSTFSDHGKNILSVNSYGYGQFYSQIGSILYMIHPVPGNTLTIFNMETKLTDGFWGSTNIPINVGSSSCLAATDEYLFITGGNYVNYLNKLQILDIHSLKWASGPNMNQQRAWHSCIVNENNNMLYAIGGGINDGLSYIYWKSIEIISIVDIEQKSWQYIANLSAPLSFTRSIIFENNIYIIGGFYRHNGTNDDGDTVHLIHGSSNAVSLLSDSLNYPIAYTSAVTVDNVLYAFGGFNKTTLSSVDKWQYYIIPTVSPTSNPSTSPSVNPSQHPSISPSDSTVNPTNTPSRNPSNYPTYNPSTNPSNSPSVNPSQHPSISPSDSTNSPSTSPIVSQSNQSNAHCIVLSFIITIFYVFVWI